MKPFKFKLESVLNLRERAEAEAQQSHAAAGRRLEAILRDLNEAEEEHKRLNQQLAGIQRSSFRPAEREILWNALKYQKDLCGQLALKMDAARKELEVKRQALLDARRDHEAMMKMQEKDLLEHTRLAQQEEALMIDDIVSARHSARRRNGGANL